MVPVEENDLKPKNFGAIYHCRSVVVVVAVTIDVMYCTGI